MDFNSFHQKIPDNIVQVEQEEQVQLVTQALINCFDKIKEEDSTADNETSRCPAVWDRIMCWSSTEADSTARQKCPDYINMFNISGYAARTCTENGTWYVNPSYNTTWTNYTECTYHQPPANDSIWHKHLDNIRIMYSVGYSLSLISLVLAVFIMLYFKKLHCPRNTVHINLFLSFILRALISLIKESALINGVGLKKDIYFDDEGKIVFKDEGLHWECKLLLVVFNYALGTNYVWIFVEGLYLHMLIFVSVFSERSHVHWYMVVGWAGPLVFIIPWVIVRALKEDVLCWNTHPTEGYLWIIQGPLALLIMVNFVFFVNIVRVLFTKMTASNACENRKYRYRKLAKSTLVLIMLFGVHYIVFLGIQRGHVNEATELAKLYFEMFFNSFQGFVVAILVCFLNGEVRSEFRKKWNRFNLRRGSFTGASSVHNNSTWNTTQTYINPTTGRNGSIALNETSNGKALTISHDSKSSPDEKSPQIGIVVDYENNLASKIQEPLYYENNKPNDDADKELLDTNKNSPVLKNSDNDYIQQRNHTLDCNTEKEKYTTDKSKEKTLINVEDLNESSGLLQSTEDSFLNSENSGNDKINKKCLISKQYDKENIDDGIISSDEDCDNTDAVAMDTVNINSNNNSVDEYSPMIV